MNSSHVHGLQPKDDKDFWTSKKKTKKRRHHNKYFTVSPAQFAKPQSLARPLEAATSSLPRCSLPAGRWPSVCIWAALLSGKRWRTGHSHLLRERPGHPSPALPALSGYLTTSWIGWADQWWTKPSSARFILCSRQWWSGNVRMESSRAAGSWPPSLPHADRNRQRMVLIEQILGKSMTRASGVLPAALPRPSFWATWPHVHQ